MKTMVTLFSSAGVGDFGFKKSGFKTIATNELLTERMEIQKLNKKCMYETGYVEGDITLEATKHQILDEILFWENRHNVTTVDVVVATPPCQGMSTANYKKSSDELPRNSLVIEALEMIDRIHPRYFVLENVRSFLKTMCKNKRTNEFEEIRETIEYYLGKQYNIFSRIINFKEYGVPSSRPRTIVIGTRKDMPNLSPLLVFPTKMKEIPLCKSIKGFKKLNSFNEFDSSDPLHMFREYPGYMRGWITPLEEGQSSFTLPTKPYKMVNGNKVTLKSEHLGNKFSRMWWDKPAPAIHTRSDQLASNRTIHPADDRVLSIRELMAVMSIPKTFSWFAQSEFNKAQDKVVFLRKKELNIRRSIGEAVPTKIFESIAKKIISVDKKPYHELYELQYSGDRQNKSAAFYTPQAVVFNVLKNVARIKKKEITVLEPSSGWGTFLPQMASFFQDYEKVTITLMDIDKEAITKGKKMFSKIKLPVNVKIKWVVGDFSQCKEKYDFVIGNPPYMKIGAKNLFNIFLEKASTVTNNISMIVPKTLNNSDSDKKLRKILSDKYNIVSYIEFGVRTFANVHIETSIFTLTTNRIETSLVQRYLDKVHKVSANYMFFDTIWLPYRNEWFDNVHKKIELGHFTSYRDRQITNKLLTNDGIWVVKSKNIVGSKLESVEGYDVFINDIGKLASAKYLDKSCIIMPNFTYNIRATIKPKGVLANGSIALIFYDGKISKTKIIKYFNSKEFLEYYQILQSFSKFTININKTVTNMFGVPNDIK